MHETLANGVDQCPLISEVAEQTLIHSPAFLCYYGNRLKISTLVTASRTAISLIFYIFNFYL